MLSTWLNCRTLALLSITFFAFSLPVLAQDPPAAEKKPEEVSKVDSVEVTPAQASSPVGGKLQFKAVAKDSAGQPLPDAVKFWFAAPFDSASADDKGEISFVQPGEITIGAVIGHLPGAVIAGVGMYARGRWRWRQVQRKRDGL